MKQLMRTLWVIGIGCLAEGLFGLFFTTMLAIIPRRDLGDMFWPRIFMLLIAALGALSMYAAYRLHGAKILGRKDILGREAPEEGLGADVDISLVWAFTAVGQAFTFPPVLFSFMMWSFVEDFGGASQYRIALLIFAPMFLLSFVSGLFFPVPEDDTLRE